jgi:Na+/H+ antiporter NhaD/arsenite permease-like protein
MAWSAGKGTFIDFLFLFPASFVGYIITAYLLYMTIPNEYPKADSDDDIKLKDGAKTVMALGIFTIIMAVVGHQLFHLPAMWGMMFGLSVLSLYSYFMKRNKDKTEFNVFHGLTKVEYDTLIFFFGILSAVGALHFLGYLALVANGYEIAGATTSNILVGFLSAIIDNVPVMSAILKANPIMPLEQWMLITLTAGIGGSLISFGSAAGVGVMGKMKGIYTFTSHFKYAWMILVGYIVSITIWYVQYQIFGLYIKH